MLLPCWAAAMFHTKQPCQLTVLYVSVMICCMETASNLQSRFFLSSYSIIVVVGFSNKQWLCHFR
jgi:hypothetical protein